LSFKIINYALMVRHTARILNLNFCQLRVNLHNLHIAWCETVKHTYINAYDSVAHGKDKVEYR
jgi:hypothetical protein